MLVFVALLVIHVTAVSANLIYIENQDMSDPDVGWVRYYSTGVCYPVYSNASTGTVSHRYRNECDANNVYFRRYAASDIQCTGNPIQVTSYISGGVYNHDLVSCDTTSSYTHTVTVSKYIANCSLPCDIEVYPAGQLTIPFDQISCDNNQLQNYHELLAATLRIRRMFSIPLFFIFHAIQSITRLIL